MEALIPFSVVISIIIFIIHLNQQHQKKIKQAWQTFATQHKFQYTAAPMIAGQYKGYRLWMDTIYRNKATYTRMKFVKLTKSIPPEKSDPEAVKKSVNTLMSTNLIGVFPYGWLQISLDEPAITYAYPKYDRNVAQLKGYFGPLTDYLEQYVAVGNLGAEAIPFLIPFAKRENELPNKLSMNLLGNIATRLIEDIGQATQQLRYSTPQPLCPNCLVHFYDHSVKLSIFKRVDYHACRYCQQSRTYLQSERVVVVLDTAMGEPWLESQGQIRINWLERRSLFDFDMVEIIQATDEDVERFAVQVGNDTDEYRNRRYQRMTCMVSPEAQLSENLLRVLQNTFGNVTTK